IGRKLHAVGLEEEQVRATARLKEALGLALPKEHPAFDEGWRPILLLTVALHDAADQQRRHFNHGNQTDAGAARHVAVEDRDHPRVLRKRHYSCHYSAWIARVVRAGYIVKIDNLGRYGNVTVVIFVRSESKDCKLASGEGPQPANMVRAQEF